MGHYNHSLSLDATIMASENWAITGKHIGIIFVTQYITIATGWPPKNTPNCGFSGLYFKNGTVKFFYIINFW